MVQSHLPGTEIFDGGPPFRLEKSLDSSSPTSEGAYSDMQPVAGKLAETLEPRRIAAMVLVVFALAENSTRKRERRTISAVKRFTGRDHSCIHHVDGTLFSAACRSS
jgi:hypothetical protein